MKDKELFKKAVAIKSILDECASVHDGILLMTHAHALYLASSFREEKEAFERASEVSAELLLEMCDKACPAVKESCR
mgnify:FL=1